jgi:hypothetical protein
VVACEVDGAVGVGRRPALADGDDERVLHPVAQAEARELGRRRGFDVEAPTGETVERGGEALARDGGGPLPDHDDAPDRAVADPLAE